MTKCTSPCVPPCENEGTHHLHNKSSGALLGCNCERHITPLLKLNEGRDYMAKPVEQPT